jgi:hypothetical protein
MRFRDERLTASGSENASGTSTNNAARVAGPRRIYLPGIRFCDSLLIRYTASSSFFLDADGHH